MNLLKRVFRAQNFKISEIGLNIKSILFPSLWIPFRKQRIKQMSIDQTIDYIIKNKTSIARFGDGEIIIMTDSQAGGGRIKISFYLKMCTSH